MTKNWQKLDKAYLRDNIFFFQSTIHYTLDCQLLAALKGVEALNN